MKIFHYILSVILGLFSLIQMFLISTTEDGFLFGMLSLMMSAIFFLFGLVEEKNEEIREIKEKYNKLTEYFMIEE